MVAKQNSVRNCTKGADALPCPATDWPLRRLRRREGDPGEDRPRDTKRPAQGSEPGAECLRSAPRVKHERPAQGSEPGAQCFLEEGCDEGTFVAGSMLPMSSQSPLNISSRAHQTRGRRA